MSAQEIKELVDEALSGALFVVAPPDLQKLHDAIDAQASELAEITRQRDT